MYLFLAFFYQAFEVQAVVLLQARGCASFPSPKAQQNSLTLFPAFRLDFANVKSVDQSFPADLFLEALTI